MISIILCIYINKEGGRKYLFDFNLDVFFENDV